MISGFMPEETTSISPYKFIHKDDIEGVIRSHAECECFVLTSGSQHAMYVVFSSP